MGSLVSRKTPSASEEGGAILDLRLDSFLRRGFVFRNSQDAIARAPARSTVKQHLHPQQISETSGIDALRDLYVRLRLQRVDAGMQKPTRWGIMYTGTL